MMMNGAMAEMPRYKCHKEVWALQIGEIVPKVNPDATGRSAAASYGATIIPADGAFAAFDVDAEYVTRHKPQASGYYVVYADGYKSYSPAEAFEDGYTKLGPAYDPPRAAPARISLANIEQVFRYQPWNEDQQQRGKAVTDALIEAGKTILRNVPECPTRTRALNDLIDSRMKANAAITHEGRY